MKKILDFLNSIPLIFYSFMIAVFLGILTSLFSCNPGFLPSIIPIRKVDTLIIEKHYYKHDSTVIIEKYYFPNVDSALNEFNKKFDALSLRIQDYVNDTNWFDTTIVHIDWKDSIRYITRKTYINKVISDNDIYYLFKGPAYKLRCYVGSLVHSGTHLYKDTVIKSPIKGSIQIINTDTADYNSGAFYKISILDTAYNFIYDSIVNIPPIQAKQIKEIPWNSHLILPIGRYIYSYVLYVHSELFPLDGCVSYFEIQKE